MPNCIGCLSIEVGQHIEGHKSEPVIISRGLHIEAVVYVKQIIKIWIDD